MTYDVSSPGKLKATQQWFASIIVRPIDEDSQMNPVSPTGFPMENEAWNFIKPSPTLTPAQRIQIYNQQYWWRLLNTLHDIFPLVTRLFGYHDFNQTIGIPYLDKYPPHHWSLNSLGDRLLQWVEEDYHQSDKQLIKDSVHLDWTYNHLFLLKEATPLHITLQNEVNSPSKDNNHGNKNQSTDTLSELLNCQLYLQPSLQFFNFSYHLPSFRYEFLQKDPDYWVENDFPELRQGPFSCVLFRNCYQEICWEEMSEGEWAVLNFFKKGSTIDEICQWIEGHEGPIVEEASQQIHHWCQKWVLRQWLCMTKP